MNSPHFERMNEMDTKLLERLRKLALWHQEWIGELAQRFAPLDLAVTRQLGELEAEIRMEENYLNFLFRANGESIPDTKLELLGQLYHNRFWFDEHFLLTDHSLAKQVLYKYHIFLSHQWIFLKRCLQEETDPYLVTPIERRLSLIERENTKLQWLRLLQSAPHSHKRTLRPVPTHHESRAGYLRDTSSPNY